MEHDKKSLIYRGLLSSNSYPLKNRMFKAT